jgi:hypothetical protein
MDPTSNEERPMLLAYAGKSLKTIDPTPAVITPRMQIGKKPLMFFKSLINEP